MAVTETGHVAARAVDDLYRRHGTEVYRYALAVLGNHADAEDVTQTTFLNAYRSLEQGVSPRKASNWLLTIASNAIKQRFRQELAHPRHVEFDDRIADASSDDVGPSVGELLTALSRIPPSQRQAIVLREFEGRSYKEIAEILGVTTSALETLLFRARRSLADELEHHLTCTEAQHAISRSVDDRLGRKERRRLREHLAECPDCAQFVASQKRHRTAFKGLMLIPVPLSLTFFKGMEGTASAATLPAAAASTAAVGAGVGAGVGTVTATGGGIFAGGLAVKTAAVVTAAGVAGGVGVVGASNVDSKPGVGPPTLSDKPGERLGQVAPRGVLVPGFGVARGKATAPGQAKRDGRPRGKVVRKAGQGALPGRSAGAKANAPGQGIRPSASPSESKAKADSSANTQTERDRNDPSSAVTEPGSSTTKLPKTNDRFNGGKTR